jgi:hypothetical protein
MDSSERRPIREHAIFELSSAIPITKCSDGVENDESNEENKEELSRRKDIASREILNFYLPAMRSHYMQE